MPLPTFKIVPRDIEQLQHLHRFYIPKFNRGGALVSLKFEKKKYLDILKDHGFYRMDQGVDNSFFVRIQDNLIQTTNRDLMGDFFQDYIEHLPDFVDSRVDDDGGSNEFIITPGLILRYFYDSLNNLVNNDLFKRLVPDQEIEILDDTADTKYITFANGVVVCDGYHTQFREYGAIDKFIWRNSILTRPYIQADGQDSVFSKFCWNIAGQDKERFGALKTLIGYNLHTYTKRKTWATILTDSAISEDGEANGRTGKTLFCNGLGKMLNRDLGSSVYCEINGRDFQARNKHKYQKANADTRLIHLNDLYNNFNIELLFNDITEGIEVDKKNEKPFTIKPKMVISTNKTIKIDGESARDRVKSFEFSGHYSSTWNPSQEFGHWFFDEWDTMEWARFDSFMIDCVQDFLKYGYLTASVINLNLRQLIENTNQDFVNFMDDITRGEGLTYTLPSKGVFDNEGYNQELKLEPGREYNKKLIYAVFKALFSDFDNDKFKQRLFTAWIRQYCKARSIRLIEDRRNGIDYVSFEF
jgi:hypothetical protein